MTFHLIGGLCLRAPLKKGISLPFFPSNTHMQINLLVSVYPQPGATNIFASPGARVSLGLVYWDGNVFLIDGKGSPFPPPTPSPSLCTFSPSLIFAHTRTRTQ